MLTYIFKVWVFGLCRYTCIQTLIISLLKVPEYGHRASLGLTRAMWKITAPQAVVKLLYDSLWD